MNIGLSESVRRIRYAKLRDRIARRYPDAKIKYKENHGFWQKTPASLRDCATTIGNTIWMPRRDYDFETLAHEYQHVVDYNEMGIFGFMMMYLQPQILAPFWFILGIMAICFQLPIFCILALAVGIICLLPWPSKSRAYLEMRGYLMSMYLGSEYDEDVAEIENFVVDSISSWLYYKMIWTRKAARELVHKAALELDDKEGLSNTSVAFRDVHEILIDTTP